MRILQLPLAVVRRAIGMRCIIHLDNHCSHFRFLFSPQGQGGTVVQAPGQTGTPRSLRPGVVTGRGDSCGASRRRYGRVAVQF
jgi:hypothetical protein